MPPQALDRAYKRHFELIPLRASISPFCFSFVSLWCLFGLVLACFLLLFYFANKSCHPPHVLDAHQHLTAALLRFFFSGPPAYLTTNTRITITTIRLLIQILLQTCHHAQGDQACYGLPHLNGICTLLDSVLIFYQERRHLECCG